MMVRLNGLLTSTRAVIVVTAVGTPGNQAANGENKPQPVTSGETSLLDSTIKIKTAHACLNDSSLATLFWWVWPA